MTHNVHAASGLLAQSRRQVPANRAIHATEYAVETHLVRQRDMRGIESETIQPGIDVRPVNVSLMEKITTLALRLQSITELKRPIGKWREGSKPRDVGPNRAWIESV